MNNSKTNSFTIIQFTIMLQTIINTSSFECCSNLFSLYNSTRTPSKEEPATNQSWMGYFGKALMTPASYLPSQVTEVFSQGRAFAIAKLPRAGKNIFTNS